MSDTWDVTRNEAMRTAVKWAMTADASLDTIGGQKADLIKWDRYPDAWAKEISEAHEIIAAEEEYRGRAIVHASVWAAIAQVAPDEAGQ